MTLHERIAQIASPPVTGENILLCIPACDNIYAMLRAAVAPHAKSFYAEETRLASELGIFYSRMCLHPTLDRAYAAEVLARTGICINHILLCDSAENVQHRLSNISLAGEGGRTVVICAGFTPTLRSSLMVNPAKWTTVNATLS